MSAAAGYDSHYLKDVTALGDSREVRTSQAIWSRSRIKLVEKGVRVDSRLHAQLMQHKLAPPIEECLAIADPVTARNLRKAAEELIGSQTGFQRLTEGARRPGDLLASLERVALDPPLAVRLTVMRERRPAMFSHAVGVALLAGYAGARAGFSAERLVRLAGAGLYHDLGELHIDPELLAAQRPLTESERRQFYTHPLTGYLILQGRPGCEGALADAVLAHHERLDGSGYPRGARGDELDEDSRILAIAEIASTFVTQPLEADALRRLPVVLKLNHRRFDRALSAHFIALGAAPAESAPAPDANGAALAAALADDPEARGELPAAARELGWLLEEVVHGVYRDAARPPSPEVAQWAEDTRRRLGQGEAAALQA